MDFSEYLSNKQIIITIMYYYYFFKMKENFIEHINYSAKYDFEGFDSATESQVHFNMYSLSYTGYIIAKIDK